MSSGCKSRTVMTRDICRSSPDAESGVPRDEELRSRQAAADDPDPPLGLTKDREIDRGRGELEGADQVFLDSGVLENGGAGAGVARGVPHPALFDAPARLTAELVLSAAVGAARTARGCAHRRSCARCSVEGEHGFLPRV